MTFRSGSTYRYHEVPVSVWKGLKQAPSAGRFLNERIKKPGFSYEKLSGREFLLERLEKKAFEGTLFKESATIEELERGYRRLGPSKGTEISGFMSVRELANMSGGAISVNPRVTPLLLQNNPTLASLGDFGEELRRVASSRIVYRLPPAQLSKQLAQHAGLAMPSSRAGQRALAAAVGLHEGFETQVNLREAMRGPQQYTQWYSHLSPNVILKEHNLLARMTGEGAQEARKALQLARLELETKDIGRHIEDMSGGRYSFAFGEGQKLPKAFRRRLLARMQAQELTGATTQAERMARAVQVVTSRLGQVR